MRDVVLEVSLYNRMLGHEHCLVSFHRPPSKNRLIRFQMISSEIRNEYLI